MPSSLSHFILGILARLEPLAGLRLSTVYVLTTALVLAAFGARLTLGAAIEAYPFLFFSPVVALVALLFGRFTWLYATILGCFLTAFYYHAPYHSFRIDSVGEVLSLAISVFVALLVGALVEALRVATSQLRRANSCLVEANEQKTLLLREVYHRIKNDLHSIIALLRIQKRHSTDEGGRAALETAVRRLSVLAKVYDRLWVPETEVLMDSADLLTGLDRDLKESLADVRPIEIRVSTESHPLRTDLAIPVGIIVNELVTNSLKHAFPDGRAGTIDVGFRRPDANYLLTVADDGIGCGSAKNPGGLGQQLVYGLATQLGGSVRMSGSPGTSYEVRLPAAG